MKKLLIIILLFTACKKAEDVTPQTNNDETEMVGLFTGTCTRNINVGNVNSAYANTTISVLDNGSSVKMVFKLLNGDTMSATISNGNISLPSQMFKTITSFCDSSTIYGSGTFTNPTMSFHLNQSYYDNISHNHYVITYDYTVTK